MRLFCAKLSWFCIPKSKRALNLTNVLITFERFSYPILSQNFNKKLTESAQNLVMGAVKNS